jgi:hypothetical protein
MTMARPTLTADDYVRGPDGPASPLTSVGIRIAADAHPDVLPRIASVLSFANKAPSSVSLRTVGDEQVLIEAALCDVPSSLADLIRRKLLQLTCVIEVEMQPLPAEANTDP